MFSCEFCKISRNTFLYRTPLVTASENKTKISFFQCPDFLLSSRHYQKIFSECLTPKLPPGCPKTPTRMLPWIHWGTYNALRSPTAHKSAYMLSAYIHLNNQSIKKTLFRPLEKTIALADENFTYILHWQKLEIVL